MKTILSVVALSLALLVVAQPGAAQKNKQDANVRSVEGVVTEASGAPAAGAVVHLENRKTLQIRSFITKEDGQYIFHGLSTNVDYQLKAEYKGASSDSKTLSVFDSRSKAIINLKLK